MAILIKSVTITPNELTAGHSFFISVNVDETKWENLRSELQSWGETRRSFKNWQAVKDFVYSIPDPEVDADCLYCADGNALFDVDAVQISVVGGGEIKYPADTIDTFIKEVKHE